MPAPISPRAAYSTPSDLFSQEVRRRRGLFGDRLHRGSASGRCFWRIGRSNRGSAANRNAYPHVNASAATIAAAGWTHHIRV